MIRVGTRKFEKLLSQGPKVIAISTLELKINYVAASLAGPFSAKGTVVKAGKSIFFLEGKLFTERGELTATASSTAKVILPKTK